MRKISVLVISILCLGSVLCACNSDENESSSDISSENRTEMVDIRTEELLEDVTTDKATIEETVPEKGSKDNPYTIGETVVIECNTAFQHKAIIEVTVKEFNAEYVLVNYKLVEYAENTPLNLSMDIFSNNLWSEKQVKIDDYLTLSKINGDWISDQPQILKGGEIDTYCIPTYYEGTDSYNGETAKYFSIMYHEYSEGIKYLDSEKKYVFFDITE